MVLVDTSIWIDHLHKGDDKLFELLHAEQVLCHPFVVGELACGHIRNRQEIMTLLATLSFVEVVKDSEVRAFIDHHKLVGQGLGLIDVHLLASCMLQGVNIWTRDRKLAITAKRLGLSDSR